MSQLTNQEEVIVIKRKLQQLTVSDAYEEPIETSRGDMSWVDWCRAEAKRINANPSRYAEVRGDGVRCAVFVDPTPAHLLKDCWCGHRHREPRTAVWQQASAVA